MVCVAMALPFRAGERNRIQYAVMNIYVMGVGCAIRVNKAHRSGSSWGEEQQQQHPSAAGECIACFHYNLSALPPRRRRPKCPSVLFVRALFILNTLRYCRLPAGGMFAAAFRLNRICNQIQTHTLNTAKTHPPLNAGTSYFKCCIKYVTSALKYLQVNAMHNSSILTCPDTTTTSNNR